MDMRGTSTLGELYLSAEMVLHDGFGGARPELEAGTVDARAVDVLRKLLSMCPGGYCRVEDYHDRLGLYARQFARRRAAAYVGYSESLFYLAEEVRQSCIPRDNCIVEKDVQVSQLPFGEKTRGVGWTDVVAMSSKCAGQCEADALAFIKFYTDDATTLSLLLPEWPSPPRYLMPAKKSLFTNPKLVKEAPLYPRLLELVSSVDMPTAPKLNDELRSIGAQLDDPAKGQLPDNPATGTHR
jgi:hypothetical protein